MIDTQVATQGSLFYALEAFVVTSDMTQTGVNDFITNFGADDMNALSEYLTDLSKNHLPAAGWKEGYEATVTAIKAHEAVMKGGKVELPDELYNVA